MSVVSKIFFYISFLSFSCQLFAALPEYDEIVLSNEEIERYASEIEAAEDSFVEKAFVSMILTWSPRIVPVCWESTRADSKRTREIVRTAVGDSWARHSALVFDGWDKCTPKFRGIRIHIADTTPHTKGLGIQLRASPFASMVLNETFEDWSPACNKDKLTKESCIYTIAVHEFGHALGFSHEQNRLDTPDDCLEPSQGNSAESVPLTPWDIDSVMNYCNPRYNNDGVLSRWDVFALQYIYGKSNE